MAVTGGDLVKMGNYFYLVMGQNATDLYAGNFVQQYSDDIKKFNISFDGTNLSCQLITKFTDGNRPDSTSRYRRRDLNVSPFLTHGGSQGISIYGGVFTSKTRSTWQNPVTFFLSVPTVKKIILDSLKQKTSQYASAKILMYDAVSQNMYTTLIGGISLYAYNNGVLEMTPTIPYVKSTATMVISAYGQSAEVGQCTRRYTS